MRRIILCAILLAGLARTAVAADFQLTIDGGNGAGAYAAGSNVAVVVELRDRFYFSHWTGDRDVLADIRDAWPSFEIPATQTSTSRFYRVRVELSE